jgi:phage shock protein A
MNSLSLLTSVAEQEDDATATRSMLRQMVLNLKDSVGKLEDKIQALKNSPEQIDRLKREMLEVDTKAIRHIHHTYLFTRT